MFLDVVKNNFKKYSSNIWKENISYKELEKYVYNVYLELLKEKQNKKEQKVIVFGHKNKLQIVSFLAASFAGVTYVPIDIGINEERFNYIIDLINPMAIIVADDVEFTYRTNCRIIEYKELEIIVEKEVKEEIILEPKLNENDTYYIIFTSGSTGIAKGVCISYLNLDTFLNSMRDEFNQKGKKYLNTSIYSFDLSVADIYVSLLNASEHISLDLRKIKEYKRIYEYINEQEPNYIVATPSFFEYLLADKNFNRNNFKSIEKIYFCGEVLNKNLVKKIKERFNNVDIINAYGPTECTVAVTKVIVDDALEEIPVGKVEDDTFIILDDDLNETNGEGNIVIYGDFVTKGYINYSNDNFIEYKGKRAYITGDIGYIENGMLYFKCRKDRQIKYHGYRIELNDIEKNILKINGVENCVVVVNKKENAMLNKVVAYVKSTRSKEEIEKEIKKVLPEYMIPTIKVVDEIPVNANFKLDRKRIEAIENEGTNN